MVDVFDYKPDVVILFLEGNDIFCYAHDWLHLTRN